MFTNYSWTVSPHKHFTHWYNKLFTAPVTVQTQSICCLLHISLSSLGPWPPHFLALLHSLLFPPTSALLHLPVQFQLPVYLIAFTGVQSQQWDTVSRKATLGGVFVCSCLVCAHCHTPGPLLPACGCEGCGVARHYQVSAVAVNLIPPW